MRTHVLLSAVTLLVGVTAGCMGRVGDPEQLPGVRGGVGGPGATGNGPGGNGTGGGTPQGLRPIPSTTRSPRAIPTRRAPCRSDGSNNLEYNNTVRDLLGDKTVRPTSSRSTRRKDSSTAGPARWPRSTPIASDRRRRASPERPVRPRWLPARGDETACAKTFVQTSASRLSGARRPTTKSRT